MEQDALSLLQTALPNFGNNLLDRALTQNIMSICHMLQGDFYNADICLKQSLLDETDSHSNSDKVHHRICNNYAVLCRLQGKYDESKAYLRQMAGHSNLDETEMFLYHLNMAKTFIAENEMDSATLYLRQVEALLPDMKIKRESQISACGSLSQFAEWQGDIQKALRFKALMEELMSKGVGPKSRAKHLPHPKAIRLREPAKCNDPENHF
ncbi:MAG: hypothetical protein IJ057_02395 [Bacteroidales bacterium]|nr:hypothetical protein [Bacteroidales bacterium]